MQIRGCRKRIALCMRMKVIDILLIAIILIYTFLVIVMLAIDDLLEGLKTVNLILQIVELVFLAIFCIEITLSIVGFGCLYFKDKWNIADFIVIFFTIIVTVIDMILADS